MIDPLEVSTHSRLKAAGSGGVRHVAGGQVSTHSRLKAAGMASGNSEAWEFVSTHSRLKAAGPPLDLWLGGLISFNTQPPEGGWVPVPSSPVLLRLFQHTAA